MLSREEVIRRIVQRELDAQSLKEEASLADAPDLHQAACERFGAWDTALQYAGVIDRRWGPKPKYTQESLLAELRKLLQSGASLKAMDTRLRDGPLLWAAIRHYGGWRKALKSAGIDVASTTRRPQSRWDRQTMIQWIRDRRREGQSLRALRRYRHDRVLAKAVKRVFGSWQKALRAAGIVTGSRTWSKDRIVAAIQARQQEGKSIRYCRVRREEKHLGDAAYRHFGTWTDALMAAGIEVQPRKIRRPRP